MDINYLYQRRAVSLHRAARASCAASRSAHLQLAAGYAAQIAGAVAPARLVRPLDTVFAK